MMYQADSPIHSRSAFTTAGFFFSPKIGEREGRKRVNVRSLRREKAKRELTGRRSLSLFVVVEVFILDT